MSSVAETTLNLIRLQVQKRTPSDTATNVFEKLNPELDFRRIPQVPNRYLSLVVQAKFDLFMQGWYAHLEAGDK